MKILLDLNKLMEEGKISKQDFDKLSEISKKDTGSVAINILAAFGIACIMGGLIAMDTNPFLGMIISFVSIGFGGLILSQGKDFKFSLLGKILTIAGILGFIIASSFIFENIYQYIPIMSFIASILAFSGGIYLRSGFLMGVSALTISSVLSISSGYGFYGSGSYGISVQNPVLSIFFYSILAFAAYQASLKYIFYESVLLVFARTCLFLVNISFWTASISGFKDVPGFVFAFAWFSLSLGLIYFGSTRNRKFLVNIGAVFAAINLYTLWFEMLGAHPVALIVAGVTIVGGSLWLWNFNKKSEN